MDTYTFSRNEWALQAAEEFLGTTCNDKIIKGFKDIIEAIYNMSSKAHHETRLRCVKDADFRYRCQREDFEFALVCSWALTNYLLRKIERYVVGTYS